MQADINNTLSKLTTSFRDLREKVLKDIGLHSGQAQVLSVLWMRDGVSQADIVRELSISAPTVNSLVAKLEKSKYLRSRKCKIDKRRKRVYLTKKGFGIRIQAEEKRQKMNEIILKDFSDTEKVLIFMLLEKINNNLQINMENL